MKEKINHRIFLFIIAVTFIFTACYEGFKGPAGYANYYMDNQSGDEIFLKYKLSDPENNEVKSTSIIYPDSAVEFHNDLMTNENPTPKKSFKWIKIYEQVNDSTEELKKQLDPVVDSLWKKEKVTNFDIGEKNWFYIYN